MFQMVQTTILVKMPLSYSELDFSIRETQMDQNGPGEVHFGPFKSANRTLAIPDRPRGPKDRQEYF